MPPVVIAVFIHDVGQLVSLTVGKLLLVVLFLIFLVGETCSNIQLYACEWK